MSPFVFHFIPLLALLRGKATFKGSYDRGEHLHLCCAAIGVYLLLGSIPAFGWVLVENATRHPVTLVTPSSSGISSRA